MLPIRFDRLLGSRIETSTNSARAFSRSTQRRQRRFLTRDDTAGRPLIHADTRAGGSQNQGYGSLASGFLRLPGLVGGVLDPVGEQVQVA
jgi:hypothetical protein